MKTRILRKPEDLKSCANTILGLDRYLPIKVTLDNYKPTRSLEQSSKMWAMLGEVSAQVVWYGAKLTPEEWKDMFSASMNGQKSAPGIDGGFVVFGARTSKMTVPEMMDMITIIEAFGAEHGVEFKE